MLQLALTIIIFLIIVIPVGRYMYHIATWNHTLADPVFDRLDGVIYKIGGVNPHQGMNWRQYALALVGTNAVMVAIGYLILRIQSVGIFNPNSIGNMEPTLAFNTIISFMTNTNLQHYSGESGLSYLSQMLVIIFMMFVSAASGYAACIAFIRGLTGKTKDDVGNFFADLTRITTRLLLPFSIVGGLLLVWQGVPQNFDANIVVNTLEGTFQTIAMGPIAALEIIKHLGTNGGGFLGANSSTPIENPTIISDLVELYSMMILPGACVIMFGLMYHNRKKLTDEAHPVVGRRLTDRQPIFGGEGRTVFVAMGIIFLVGLSVCYWAELQGNPALADIGLSQSMGSMEGKEIRIGSAASAMWGMTTTVTSNGSVNSMHDSQTPLSGMLQMLNMQINCWFGGVGVGFMNYYAFIIIAVFISGLMVGRTPEFLGKKIEAREMKIATMVVLMHPLIILVGTALASHLAAQNPELAGAWLNNPSFHGFSEMLYEYTSCAANNGSGFEGLSDNTPFWNITCGIVLILGRYFPIVGQVAIAGLLASKKYIPESAGTLKTDTATFALMTFAVIVIVAALAFFPAQALGPIADYLSK